MRRPVGLTLLTAFFVVGALMAFVAFLGLLLSGGFLEPIWRLNPDAHRALTELGAWGMLLMAVVAINLFGDVTNAVTRGDLRTLIGIPIGGAMIFYLLRARTRAHFEVRSAAV